MPVVYDKNSDCSENKIMKKLSSWLKEQKITEVEAVIADFTGIARGKIMPSSKLLRKKAYVCRRIF